MGASLCPSSFFQSLKKNKNSINESFSTTKISQYFKLQQRSSSLTQEFIAATATFLTMSYIITVNATILSDSGGTCSAADCASPSPACALASDPGYLSCIHKVKNDLIVATAVSSMAASLAMGVFANLPLALAPGMGANAYLAYEVVGFHGSGSISYGSGLAVVFLEGCVFFVMALVGMRAKIGRFIPRSVRLGSAAGIGLFIAFVGMQRHQGIALVGPDPSTLVTLAACDAVDSVGGACTGHRLRSPTFWLGVVGFLVICYCLMKNIKGSMVYGIALVTAVSWMRGTSVTIFPYTNEGETSFQYFKKVVDFHKIQSTAGALSFKGFTKGNVWVAFFTLLYVDILSTTGTLYTMAELAGFSVYNEEGDEAGFEGEYAAYMVDAGATVVGAALGVSPIAVYVESSAGIKEGGRTGLTAVFVGLYFFFSLFFVPLLASVPPWAVGGPLIVVGVMMMKVVRDVEWENVREAVCAFVTMALMPLTYSISNGIVGGIGVWVVLGGFDYVVGRVKWFIKVREVVAAEQNQVSTSTTAARGDRTPDVLQHV